MPAKRTLILGAGAAGLSLCHALLERGVTDDIVIFDRKTAFTDDRTWCFWDTFPHSYSHLASSCWHRWDVLGPGEQRAAQTGVGVGYACLHGADFYASVLETLAHSLNVTLKLGCPAGTVSQTAHGVTVEAGGETWDGDYVFDSRPRPAPPGGLSFSQRFWGQFVQTETPAFDPARCTLMDFRTPQDDGLHFVYVLPFSPTEALVENTYIVGTDTPPLSAERHRAEIRAYLAEHRGLEAFTVSREEAGAIPMTTQAFPRRDGRVFFLGTAGGCAKPSSGYTFTRIQAQVEQLAEAAAAGTLAGFRGTPAPWRYRFFDTVFLQALHDRPGAFPGYFHRLFSRVSPEALTAFLSESSTWQSDISILRSLPLGPFLGAALRAAPLLLPPLSS